MDTLFGWRFREKPQGTEALERALANVLKPVLPTQDFANRLQVRLVEQAHTAAGVTRANLAQFMLLSTAAVLSASVLLLTGIRVILAVAGAIGLIYHQVEQEKRPAVPVRSG